MTFIFGCLCCSYTDLIFFTLQAHYPIPDCIDLRLYPDHTLLLEEGEAFVVINGIELNACEIIAMRVSFEATTPCTPFKVIP